MPARNQMLPAASSSICSKRSTAAPCSVQLAPLNSATPLSTWLATQMWPAWSTSTSLSEFHGGLQGSCEPTLYEVQPAAPSKCQMAATLFCTLELLSHTLPSAATSSDWIVLCSSGELAVVQVVSTPAFQRTRPLSVAIHAVPSAAHSTSLVKAAGNVPSFVDHVVHRSASRSY